MANANRKRAGVAVFGLLLYIGRTSAAEEQLVVVVDVTNLADINTEHLKYAEQQAALVFEEIGVCLQWVAHGQQTARSTSGAFELRLVLLSRKLADDITKTNIKHDVLGLSVPPARVAYVFSSQILMTTSRRGMSFPKGLGLVMAHELGHLLLRGQSHTLVGVMCKSVLCAGRGDAFSKDQRALIRALISKATKATRRPESTNEVR